MARRITYTRGRRAGESVIHPNDGFADWLIRTNWATDGGPVEFPNQPAEQSSKTPAKQSTKA